MVACGHYNQLFFKDKQSVVGSMWGHAWVRFLALTWREAESLDSGGGWMEGKGSNPQGLLFCAGVSTARSAGAQQKRLRDLPAVSEFHEKLRRVLLRGPGPPSPSRQRVHHAPGTQVHRQLCRLLLGCPPLQRTEL